MSDTVSTEQLILEVRSLREQNAKQADARHKLNNELTQSIGQFAHQSMQQADRMAAMEGSVRQIMEAINPLRTLAHDLNAIKQRLIGDAALKSEGLIQQHAAVELRLDLVERETKENTEKLRYLKWERTIVFTVLAVTGAVLTWLKSSNFVQWLTN